MKYLSQNRSGAALLTVLVAMMIIFVMIFEFQYSARVEAQLAYNDLNQMQAYYLAKSGIRIGLLRVSLYGRARKNKDLKSLAQGLDISPYLEMIWNVPLPPFPPEKSTIKKLVKADKDAAEKVLEETRVSDGVSSHVITSESSKINLNFLLVPPQQRNERVTFTTTSPPTSLFQAVAYALISLMDNFIKESDNPTDEYGNLHPEDVVYNIMDWINPGAIRFQGGAKDAWYEQQKPPYKAKRNRFYSINELKLVRDIDDHLFDKLKPYVTVYSDDGKININSISNTLLKALYRDFTDDDIKRINEEHTKRGAWFAPNDLIDYVGTTLGRTGFKTLYQTSNPFTVSNRSFLIESMGVIKKSKSQVQKIIRVAVALTQGKAGTADPSITNPADCTKAGKYWDVRTNSCTIPPQNATDCAYIFAGQWLEITPGVFCCKVPNMAPACPQGTGQNPNPQQPANPANPGAAPPVDEPSALRILFWSES